MEILTFGLSLSVNRKQLCPNVKANKAVTASLLNFHSKPTASQASVQLCRLRGVQKSLGRQSHLRVRKGYSVSTV